MNCPSCHTPIEGTPAFCQTCGTAVPRDLPPDPMIGRTLAGRFKIMKLLGEGGMGAVYVGEQMLGTTARKVAIKTLHSHLSRDPSVRARFNREVGTLAGLTHPNTVQVFDFGTTDDGLLYIAMEFIQGRSLSDILEKEGPMTPERVAHVVTQICGSLAEAHAQGIIHRDLKPDNVVLTDRVGQKDVVKVLDFGIAKRSGEEDKNEPKLTQQGMVLGTPPYMSPEQFTGQPLDARSDIYSLAVMVYELLTGKLPFEAGTAWEWATLHMTAAPKAIEAQPNGALLPESMRGAIMKALSKDPAQRFSSVNEFLDRFTGKTAATAMEIAQRQPTANFGPKLAPIAPAFAGPTPAGQTQGPFAATPDPGLEQQKGRTQIGEPVAIPMEAFAPGTGPGAPMAPYPAPAANPYGAHSHATPGGVPQQMYAPQSQSGGGGNRGLLIGVIALIGVLSAAALGFGMWHNSSGGAKEVPIEPIATPTPTTPAAPTDTTPTTVDPTTPAPLPNTPSHIPPAQPAHPTQPAHPQQPAPQQPAPQQPAPHQPAPQQPPPQQPPPQQPPPQQPPPQQPPPQQPPPQQPPHIEPAACIQAKAVPKGTPTWNRLASQCRAAGGNPG